MNGMGNDVNQGTTNFRNIGIILSSVLLSAIGQLLFKAALNDFGELSLSLDTAFKLATNALFLLGFFTYVFSAFLWLLALMKSEISFAYPFLSMAYVVVLVGGVVVFDDELTLSRIVGVVVISIGLWVIAWSERKNDISTPE